MLINHTLRSRVRRNKDVLPSASKSGTIVYNTVRTYGVQPWIEYVFAFLLAEMGHETHVLYDDGMMEQWDDIQAHLLSSPHKAPTSPPRLRKPPSNTAWLASTSTLRSTYPEQAFGRTASVPGELRMDGQISFWIGTETIAPAREC